MAIRKFIESNNQILKNMTWLTVLQFANYLLPVLILPYIVRILGVEVFGKISYAQNIITYFTLFINFGFEYSATRRIAINKANKSVVGSIFWSVIKQKSILLLISSIGLIILFFFNSKVHNDFTLYLFVFFINIGIVLFPTWFFQGVEEMSKMAIFNVIIKFLGLIVTVIIVKSASDYLLYPLFISIAYILCGIGALIYVIKHFNIPYSKTDKNVDKEIFKEGLPIFLNNIFVSGYTTANMTILGIFASDMVLGYYSGAHKIIMAILMMTSAPISMSIYPAISRKFAESHNLGMQYFKKLIIGLTIVSISISVLTYFLAPLLVQIILGNEFEPALKLLKLFSLLPFLVIMASLFTILGVYGSGLQKYSPYIGGSIGLFCVIFNLLMIPRYGMYGAAMGWIISQILEIIISGLIFFRFKKQI